MRSRGVPHAAARPVSRGGAAGQMIVGARLGPGERRPPDGRPGREEELCAIAFGQVAESDDGGGTGQPWVRQGGGWPPQTPVTYRLVGTGAFSQAPLPLATTVHGPSPIRFQTSRLGRGTALFDV